MEMSNPVTGAHTGGPSSAPGAVQVWTLHSRSDLRFRRRSLTFSFARTMKSPEVHSQLTAELAPWFKSEDFQRAKGRLGWSRPHGDAHIVVWCQISQDGWDCYAGSKFVVEFQRSPEPVIGSRNARRERFGFFLTPEEREEVRSIQNSVIAALRCPPASHPTLHVSQQVTDWYLEKFKPIREPYSEQDDIWLRYASANDVTRWAHFILNKLPKCIDAVEEWANKPMQPTPR